MNKKGRITRYTFQKRKRRKKIIWFIILLISLIISILCIVKIFFWNKDNQSIDKITDDINSKKIVKEVSSDEAENVNPPIDESNDYWDYVKMDMISVDFNELKKKNSDTVGFIKVNGTNVNYPIVQGDNNSYYLNHSYDKSYNSYGSIFMDYSSNNDFSDLNTFLYGHYTGNGSMFGELKKYMNESFYLEHPFFYILTPQQNYKVEVFSVYTDEALSNSYNSNFGSLYDFKIYLEIIKNKRRYKTNTNVNYVLDRIITLYSCSHESGSKTERYFIHGKIISLSE